VHCPPPPAGPSAFLSIGRIAAFVGGSIYAGQKMGALQAEANAADIKLLAEFDLAEARKPAAERHVLGTLRRRGRVALLGLTTADGVLFRKALQSPAASDIKMKNQQKKTYFFVGGIIVLSSSIVFFFRLLAGFLPVRFFIWHSISFFAHFVFRLSIFPVSFFSCRLPLPQPDLSMPPCSQHRSRSRTATTTKSLGQCNAHAIGRLLHSSVTII
jgi:hypothetical protein